MHQCLFPQRFHTKSARLEYVHSTSRAPEQHLLDRAVEIVGVSVVTERIWLFF
ncbi:hypothetical protein I550_2278 [Mycobacterium intracellulare 1956]|uniref:Uncharacterized protein n=1 Tax=Mycobacterium intracellulare 1956 TaxID=1299331 RepID=X8CRV7_MYCIT|nr:hypothetical protein I550_2278 [Mycobacterium intracellulare 1956]